MRTRLGIVIAGVLAFMAMVSGVVVVHGYRGPVTDELSAWLRNEPTDAIKSDMLIPYVSDPRHAPNYVMFHKSTGSVLMTIDRSSPSGRRINLDFVASNLVRSFLVDGAVDCREWGGVVPLEPDTPMPPFPLPGSVQPDYFHMRTQARVTRSVDAQGNVVWVSSGTTFNVRDMPKFSSAYVGLLLHFKTSGQALWLAFNERHFGGKDLTLVEGFAEVTRTGDNAWELRPIVDPPYPIGVANQANLFVGIPSVRKVHTGGNCDLGDWLMPFSITLLR